MTSRHRAKVDRKLREHKRKMNKTLERKSNKSKKDPGIPSGFVEKESFLQTLKDEHEKEKRQRGLARNRSAAGSKSAGYSVKEPKTKMEKPNTSTMHELFGVYENSDVLLAVLDARDPIGSRLPFLEDLVAQSGGQKHLVYVMNKIDLIPQEVLNQWLTFLRRDYPTIAFKSSNQAHSSVSRSAPELSSLPTFSSKECFGAENLIQLLKNLCRKTGMKTSIKVGVVGYPNVGKSSLINSLKRSKVCKVGARVGITTQAQEIRLDGDIKLIDSPGVVRPSSGSADDIATLFLRNCLELERIEDPITPIQNIIDHVSTERLMMIYSLSRFQSAEEFLLQLAQKTGKLKKGGIPDLLATAKIVLRDWNSGKIPYYVSPPATIASDSKEGEAVVLDALSPAFNI